MKKQKQCNPVLIPNLRLGNAKHNHCGFPGRRLGAELKVHIKINKTDLYLLATNPF